MTRQGWKSFVLIAILLWGGMLSFGYAKKKKAANSTPKPGTRLASCDKPRIGIVIPEFIVLQPATGGVPQPVTVTVLGTCLTSVKFVPEGDAPAPNPQVIPPPAPAATTAVAAPAPSPIYELSATVQFSGEGHYTVCVASDPTCVSGNGPVIEVVSADACGPVTPGEQPITQLKSETLLPETTPPIAASCSLPEGPVDKAIIVDGGTGIACEAADPGKPNSGCLDAPQTKKPLYLKAGDIASVYITNKDPFRETYKFSSNDTLIKDDDIGSFLALLVPSLGAGSSKSASSDTSKSTKADEALKAAEDQSLQPSTAENHSEVDKLGQDESTAASTFADLQELQENQINLLPPREAAAVKADHQSAKPAFSQFSYNIASARKAHENFEKALSQSSPKAEADARKSVRDEYSKYLDGLKNLKEIQDKLNDAQKHIQLVENKTKSCTASLQQRVDNLILNYRYFASTYNEARNQLISSKPQMRSDAAYCDKLRTDSIGLWELVTRENEKILDAQLQLNLRDLSVVIGRQRQADDKKINDKPTLGAPDGSDAVKIPNCFLKALHSQVSPVLSSSITALESVMINPNSFISNFQIGPYTDSTQVDWTLTRNIIKPSIAGLSVAGFNSAIDDCINPPGAPNNTKGKDSSAGLDSPDVHFLSRHAAAISPEVHLQNASLRLVSAHTFLVHASSQNQGDKTKSKSGSKPGFSKDSSTSSGDNSSDSSSQQTSSGTSGDDSKVTTRGRRINFGKERVIVSIGAVWAHLSQQNIGTGLGIPQFDASGKSLTGATTPPSITTIIIQTNHSSFRLSPMAFLNTRLLDWQKWQEPFYFTFGITAKSSDAGVKPEYLLGFSQSFAERHLFLTGGVYLGQQASLGGNLKFNQQIPSGLTGSLPVNSVYGPGFTFGVSWRVPGLAK